jgi:two-component system, chemotaxis family, protein-glutamate methylesterase/glutaminase
MTTDDRLDALRRHDPAIIAIGASAGAIEALGRLLPPLPAAFPAPILVVVHVPPHPDNALPAALATHTALRVREAEDKLTPAAGSIYVAPADYHLLVERDGTLALSIDEPVLYSRPSIDVLLESAAYASPRRVLGILLSGASADGAAGLARLWARGGLTWVQEPASAAVPVMPRAALALAPHAVLDPGDMGRLLATWSSCHDRKAQR